MSFIRKADNLFAELNNIFPSSLTIQWLYWKLFLANNGNAQYYPNQNRNNQGSLPNNGFASGNRFNDAGPPVNSGAPTNLSPNLDPEYYQPADSNMEDVAYRFNLFDIELLNVSIVFCLLKYVLRYMFWKSYWGPKQNFLNLLYSIGKKR